MNIHRVKNIVVPVLCFGVLLLAGCTNFITPEVGVTAREDARIDLVEGGVQNGSLDTKDLTLTYSLYEKGNTFKVSGSLSFASSLTYSFPLAKSFFLKMSFLDYEGRVLETINITPPKVMINLMDGLNEEIPVEASCSRPMGARAVAFNYFGEFKGRENDELGGSQWKIFYFPFE